MATKHFCDGCGKELDRNYISRRLEGAFNISPDGEAFMVEIILGFDRTWNKGEICGSCLKKLLVRILDNIEADEPEVLAKA